MSPENLHSAEGRQSAEAAIHELMPKGLHAPLSALLRPAIHIQATVTEDAALPSGASKFGGAPDVPAGFSWPLFKNHPIPFVAQFNLADVAPWDVENLLPHNGLLSFFFSHEAYGGGTGPQVYWFQENEYQRLPLPDAFRPKPKPSGLLANLKARLSSSHFAPPVPPCRLSFETRWQLPEADSILVQNHLGDEEVWEIYNEELWERVYGQGPQHQLLGYPESVQGDVLSSSTQSANTEARERQLLFQQDSQQEWLWGDVGKIYFLIRRQDLEERRFEKVEVEFQCG